MDVRLPCELAKFQFVDVRGQLTVLTCSDLCNCDWIASLPAQGKFKI